ncbi:MAG: thioredoxin domain-containing protein [Desulfovibrio sp.]|nr:thioredoxin domain-containing protein [Desulfovibrio sp.]
MKPAFFRTHPYISLLFPCLLPFASIAPPACGPVLGAQTGAGEVSVREAVRRELHEHPELVLDILKENSETVLEIAQQGNMLRRRKSLLAQWEQDVKQRKIVKLDDRSFRGKADAPVTMVVYSDFTCPYCRQAEYDVSRLLQKYDGKLRMTFKALPKEDPVSATAAKFATAAFLLDPVKGWEFHDALFNGSEQYEREGEEFLKKTAESLGYDFKKLKSAANSPAVRQRLDFDGKEADNLGISGTPHFLINDLMVRGAVGRELFEEAVETALRHAGKQ